MVKKANKEWRDSGRKNSRHSAGEEFKMWDQKHWKWKYPYWIADVLLVLVFLVMNWLFPALELRWKLLAAVAAAAVAGVVIYLVNKNRPPEPEEENEEDPYPPF